MNGNYGNTPMNNSDPSFHKTQYTPSPESYGMKWHKFLIYFSLWAGAVVNIGMAYRFFLGLQYDNAETARIVYTYYPGLKICDEFYAIALLLMAVAIIYIRFQLASFKQGAPVKLTVYFVVNILLTFIYALAASASTDLEIGDFISIGGIIGYVIYIVANNVYYKKREELFYN